ncbi:MAG: hypothetical protein HY293_14380 [Planctomycetes bacterium]|nr:hypothetical protein [Planctomycetota bacterium]
MEAATESLKPKGWPTPPCQGATQKASASTPLFEAPNSSGTGSGFVPPMVYVHCDLCGASIPCIAERLMGRDRL